jgi:hypothetical protein
MIIILLWMYAIKRRDTITLLFQSSLSWGGGCNVAADLQCRATLCMNSCP